MTRRGIDVAVSEAGRGEDYFLWRDLGCGRSDREAGDGAPRDRCGQEAEVDRVVPAASRLEVCQFSRAKKGLQGTTR